MHHERAFPGRNSGTMASGKAGASTVSALNSRRTVRQRLLN
jgi:hypothetical protein